MKIPTLKDVKAKAAENGYEVVEQHCKLNGQKCYKLRGYSHGLMTIGDLRNVLIYNLVDEEKDEFEEIDLFAEDDNQHK